MTNQKKGRTPFESAPQGNTSASNSTASALAWILAAAIVALLGEVAR